MKKIILIIVAILVPVSIYLVPSFIKVSISCKTQYGECPSGIESGIMNLESRDLRTAKREINKNLKNNILVSDYSTQFKLPSKLEVNIVIKKPSFAVKDVNSGEFFLVERDGLIVSKVTETSLPKVQVSGKAHQVGKGVDSRELFALNIIEGVFTMYQVDSGEVIDGSLVVELPAGLRVIFPLEGDRDVILGSLRLIYSKLETEEFRGKFREIDLRFKNPVLR